MNIIKLHTLNKYLSEDQIEGVLYILKKANKPLQLEQIITKTGLPAQTVKDFLKSTGYVDSLDKIELNDLGKKSINDSVKPYKWSLISFKKSKALSLIKEIRQKYSITAKREFDQFFATENTSVNKAAIVNKKGLKDKSIAVLGDDDLVSVLISILYKPYKITVFEIDEEIINLIKKISQDYSLNIEVIKYNALEELQPNFENRYNIVITDPPYTEQGVELFIDRSISLLNKDGFTNYIYLYYGNSFKTLEKTLKIQEIFSKYSLVIEDSIYKFSRYIGASSIGNASTLYILRPTLNTTARRRKVDNIYTYQSINSKNFPYVEQYTAKLGNVPSEFFKSINTLDGAIRDLCKKHNLKIVDNKITRFENGGKTLVYILANSNLTVHTWPEKGFLHLNILVCAKITNSNILINNLISIFKTNNVDLRRVE